MKNNNIGIIKVTNKKKTPSGPTTPAWFKEWYKQFKKENDARWERQEKINNSCPSWFKEFKKENDQRWKEQFEFNKLMIEFKDMVLDQFKKHKWI